MLAPTLTRKVAAIAAAGALVMTAAAALPSEAKGAVGFPDGSVMRATISCDFGTGYTFTYFNSFGFGYAAIQIYNWQTGRWVYNSGWVNAPAAFVNGWGSSWRYGPGRFTFRTWFGRYINGHWVTGADHDAVCIF